MENTGNKVLRAFGLREEILKRTNDKQILELFEDNSKHTTTTVVEYFGLSNKTEEMETYGLKCQFLSFIVKSKKEDEEKNKDVGINKLIELIQYLLVNRVVFKMFTTLMMEFPNSPEGHLRNIYYFYFIPNYDFIQSESFLENRNSLNKLLSRIPSLNMVRACSEGELTSGVIDLIC